jgi:hypothetical protein
MASKCQSRTGCRVGYLRDRRFGLSGQVRCGCHLTDQRDGIHLTETAPLEELRRLEFGNHRHWKAVADLTRDKPILAMDARGNV